MEMVEGKADSLEMANKNNGWLVIEFKTLPCTTLYFLVTGLDGKDGR
jgi:hypothetical protein